jgi:arylsulfatase A-like enzyme
MTQPNVLVFFTDQQRWDTCGCYGENAMNLTPALDRMAAGGTLVRHSFTVQPVCAPARGCFQTGRYATQHGVWRNGFALPRTERTLAHHFGRSGYLTGYIGKWHLAKTEAQPVPDPLRGGYEFWLGADCLEFTSHPYDFRVFDNDDRPFHRPGYRVDAETDCVLDFLERRAQERDRPFLLFTSYLEPHQQNDMQRLVAPEGYAEKYRKNFYLPPDLVDTEGDWRREIADYYGMIARLDENLGRVRETLQRTGLDENTIVLFCSDHGCHFRTRNDEYKRSCHEASIRVPTVFAGPGFPPGTVVDELVCIPDWTATLLDAARIAVPPEMEGRSLLPLLKGRREGWPDEVFIQISESQVGRALRTKRWKYGVTAPGKVGWQVSCSDTYVEQYLYDLENDPAERDNLVYKPEWSALRSDLAARLKRRMTAIGEAEPQILPAP